VSSPFKLFFYQLNFHQTWYEHYAFGAYPQVRDFLSLKTSTKLEIPGVRIKYLISCLCIESRSHLRQQHAGIQTGGTNLHIIKCRFSCLIVRPLLHNCLPKHTDATPLPFEDAQWAEDEGSVGEPHLVLGYMYRRIKISAAPVAYYAFLLNRRKRCCVVSFLDTVLFYK
jgi:hypothetical protein